MSMRQVYGSLVWKIKNRRCLHNDNPVILTENTIKAYNGAIESDIRAIKRLLESFPNRYQSLKYQWVCNQSIFDLITSHSKELFLIGCELLRQEGVL